MTQTKLPARRGRPKGAKNKKTLLAEAARKDILVKAGDLMLEKVEAVVRTVLEQALEGCTTSQKLILDRLVPARKASDGSATPERPVVHISIQGPAEPAQAGVIIEGGTLEED